MFYILIINTILSSLSIMYLIIDGYFVINQYNDDFDEFIYNNVHCLDIIY